jgi:2-C-methyl-D-erythritol 4-phosphate cytidylyltransferase/2-C-methyl-D-erythritol 2,4-cyclodiphosphate synthase
MTVRTAAIIVAAGRGTRAGGGLPKQWRRLGPARVADLAVAAFARHPRVGSVILVHHPDDLALIDPGSPARPVAGGATRRESVLAGLAAAEGLADRVLIHDAARPLVPAALIDRVLDALDGAPGAAPGLPVTDALWRGQAGRVTGIADRSGLWRAQTPQGFHLDAILAAHRAHRGEAADDVAVALAAGLAVAIVPGEERNLKITLPEDFDRAARLMETAMDIRTGNGFDVHRFAEGDHVRLCGVRIPFARGLEGHSDADVGMHAVTDAIYGALALGDIGQHFPPSDPQWRGAASETFLAHACACAREAGFRICHADCTLICEMPKIGPHAAAMRQEMARIMGLDPDRVSVKATTSERLGFTGRGEGIAAIATATLVKG